MLDKSHEKKKQWSNKTFSMRFRFLVTVILAMFVVTIFIGGLSIYEVDNYIQSQAEDFVNVTCTNESAQINSSLNNMEKSVKIMESYLMDFFTSKDDIRDRALQEKVIKSADQMFVDIAKHTSTSGAIAYYFRFAPSVSDGKTGLFYTKLKGNDEFVSFEPTDLLIYEKDDTEHVGWFWQPYEAGKPIWMKPYHNKNNDIVMISYVVPMYFEGEFFGIVGMDFDYTILTDIVHSIEVYENGFAHLVIDGEIICGEHQSDVIDNVDPKEYLKVSQELTNGMTLVLLASYYDIKQIRYEISFEILFTVVILSVLFTVIAFIIVKKIVDPLKKLTYAAQKLSDGNYDVDIVQSNTYEIKLLSAAFENMTKRLQEREELLRISANRDSLTGLRNTTSYSAWVANFDKAINGTNTDFGVVVLDLNELKETNDKYGHAVGDKLIATAAKVISDVFKRSPVFRIGGDEFLVVLQNRDLENHEKLFEEFSENCANTFIEEENAKIPLRVARGFARYNASEDAQFLDVFKRADDAMYENKLKTKAALVK
ncbi:MAG: diguanylate cyclase [Clostridia bacterium]|nr:diguanylate cyclase [Clostridia bacterium]